MALLEAGVNAGASLLGGVLGYFGQKSANQAALQRMREQNDFVERMWNKGNEYNTPYEQRKRYEAAGINPYMALGNIQAGNAQGSVTPAPPAPVGNAGAFLGAGVAGGANAAVNTYLQNQLISSQVQKNLADADAVRTDTPYIGRRNEADIASTEAGTENMRTKTDLDRVNILIANADLDRIKQMTPIEVQLMQANVENVTANTSLTKLQERINDWEFKNIKPLQVQELKARISQAYATIGYLVAQGRLSNAQAGLVAQMTLTEIQKTEGVRWDNMLKKDDFGRRDVDFWTEMENKRAQTKYLNSQSEKTDDDNTREWIGVVMDAVYGGMNVGAAMTPQPYHPTSSDGGFRGGVPKTGTFRTPPPPPRPRSPAPRGLPNRR